MRQLGEDALPVGGCELLDGDVGIAQSRHPLRDGLAAQHQTDLIDQRLAGHRLELAPALQGLLRQHDVAGTVVRQAEDAGHAGRGPGRGGDAVSIDADHLVAALGERAHRG